MGELLEAWIVDARVDNRDIGEYFNSKFGLDEEGKHNPDVWHWFDPKKIRTHSEKHMTDRHEIMKRAVRRGMTGNISLENAVMDQLTGLEALATQGRIKLNKGEINVESLGDLLKVYDYQHKILGGDKVEIKIGGGGGLSMPPQILTQIVSVMREFIDPRRQAEFRAKLDKDLFPLFKQYAESWEDETGKDFTKAQLAPGDVESTAVEDDNEFFGDEGSNGRGPEAES